ncbi:hypothetical protein FRC08_014264 [Ceratobasidium sp. 394]|nr:hypothetical protein FRC08_014264 [Ceratobasidium sp. 394]KAG9089934.1 hypothetical protein FS749_000950 [Ceratobasidium sp. UAMH 11750]
MNGSSRRESQSASSPLTWSNGALVPTSSGNTSMGLIPGVAATLRSLQAQNFSALSQAIAQLDSASEIQNELVSARAAYAQVSSDLRKAVDQNLVQANQLQQSKDELNSVNVMLHGAREQLFLLERKLENIGVEAAARERQRTAARDAEKEGQIEALSSALQVANARITNLNNKLQSVTTAVGPIRAAEPASLTKETFEASSSSLQKFDQWLSSYSEDLGQAVGTKVGGMTSPPLEATSMASSVSLDNINSSTNQLHNLPPELGEEITQLVNTCFQAHKDEKQKILSQLRSLRADFGNILNVARASASRSTALEATFKTILALELQPASLVPNPLAGMEGDVEMDEERTQAARAARQASMPTISDAQSPYILSAVTQPSTPSQPMFPLGSVSPQRKRQRTSTGASTPEQLPRDHELHALVRLVNTAYDIRGGQNGTDGGDPQPVQRQLVCRACNARHQAQPEYALTSFDYDQDSKLVVPSLAGAEQAQTRIRPWVMHIEDKHQKMYARFMDGFKNQANTRRHSTASMGKGT